jgi:hypothetical protein
MSRLSDRLSKADVQAIARIVWQVRQERLRRQQTGQEQAGQAEGRPGDGDGDAATGP